jgi:hypothetical protein
MNKSWKISCLGLVVLACGGRPDAWDASGELPVTSVGLSGSVAVLDEPLERVLFLTSPAAQELSVTDAQVGKNVVSATPSGDRQTLFVLSRGVQPRRNPGDERPSLTVLDGGISPKVRSRYTLTDPLQGLALDPQGKWAVVYDAGGIVVNPNELIFVDLESDADPVSKTIRSFGGRPQRLTFTGLLSVPNGEARRFLIVETDRDVTLIDLSDLARDEVTIQLPKTGSGASGKPAQVDFHEGDPLNPNDTRIAIRLEGDSNVLLVGLGPVGPGSEDKPFLATLNEADVGGVPGSIAFVRTEGDVLKLAALVPTLRSAALVDPATTVVDSLALPMAFSHITRITDDVDVKPASSDVALLWSEQADGVAFWRLGRTTDQLFRSVEALDIGISVGSVKAVPPEGLSHLKILENPGASEFYVLDLNERQSFPMLTDAPGFEVAVAPDGLRAWALDPGTPKVASIRLDDLHPTSVELERDVVAVYDVERADGSGRSAIALHAIRENALGATVLDATAPDTAKTRFYGGLLLGGLK